VLNECLVMYRVNGYAESLEKVRENDLFIRYATVRSRGFREPFARYLQRPSTKLFSNCVVPLKYLKYLTLGHIARRLEPVADAIAHDLDPDNLHRLTI
jgi:hypothetical protein